MARKLNLTRADRLGYVAGGIALIAWALRRPSWLRGGAAGMGGWLLYQAYTGSNPLFRPLRIRVNPRPRHADAHETIVVEDAITISRPRGEVFAFWRQPENLPRVLDCVAELVRETAGEELAWRGMRGGRLAHFGSLEFRDAPGGRGTIVGARLEYLPSGGSLGTALAHITGRAPQRVLAESLRRSRALLETGEVPTTHGQPAGAR
jgi:uncharacterized membrane protein